MKKKKFDKGTAVYAGIIVLLIAIFIGIFVYGLNKVLAMEGTMEPHEVTEGITAAPVTVGDGVEYLNKVIDYALEEKPQMSRSDSFSVDNVNVENDEKLTKFASYVADEMEEKLEDGFEGVERNFGEGFDDVLMMPNLTTSEVAMYEYYECSSCGRRQEEDGETCDDCGAEHSFVKNEAQAYTDYIYYKCPSCGETSNIPLESCEPCGSTQPYYLCYRDNYNITMMVTSAALEKTFAPLTKDEALALVSDELEGVLSVDYYDIAYDSLRVYYEVDRLTDKLQYLEYRKDMTITANVTFVGDYAEEGSKTITFNVTEKNKFSFTWPGLELDKHELVIEPKGTDNLLATLICDDPTQYKATWGTMDTNVCTVDEEGYLKAGKEAGETTIVAEYTFNGVTYKDSCTVYVRVPVEGLSINERDAELSVGDTLKLVTTTDPTDATVTSVKWYSEDESVATVNEYGLVTAVAKGQVTVYALSDDGYFKSSCEVTVK